MVLLCRQCTKQRAGSRHANHYLLLFTSDEHAGHVWGVHKGVRILKLEKESFAAVQNPVASRSTRLAGLSTACKQRARASQASRRALPQASRPCATWCVTWQKRGYVLVDGSDDPRAQVGSEHNVLAAVMAGCLAPHLPPAAFTSAVVPAAVPANQSMRLLLAAALREHDRKRASAAPRKLE